MLYKVSVLHPLVKKYYPATSEIETALLMELVLHGLAAHSLISKRNIDGRVEFKDLMGSMLNLGNTANYGDENFDEEDYN